MSWEIADEATINCESAVEQMAKPIGERSCIRPHTIVIVGRNDAVVNAVGAIVIIEPRVLCEGQGGES